MELVNFGGGADQLLEAISTGVAARAVGLRRGCYRGLTKMSLQGVATAAALINLDRIAAWFAVRLLAPIILEAEEYPAEDFRSQGDPRLQGANLDDNMKVAGLVNEIGSRHDATAKQVALAWLMQIRDGIAPIPGTKHRISLEENLGAADVHLSPEDVSRLDQVLATFQALGERYGEKAMTDR